MNTDSTSLFTCDRDCFVSFTLLFVIGLTYRANHDLVARVSRAWCRLHKSPRDLDWFIWLSRLILIGRVVALALVCRIKPSVNVISILC